MAKSKRNFGRPVLGDIIEIPLSKGFAYAQYINNHTAPPRYGTLIRILPDTYHKRPTDFTKLAEGKELYSVFFHIRFRSEAKAGHTRFK